MGCSSSKIIEMTNHNKARSTNALLQKEKKVEAILISKKIQNGNELQDKIINLVEKNENQHVKIMKENLENEKANLNCNKLGIGNNPESSNDNALLKIKKNLAEKRELTNNVDNSENKAQNNLSNVENKSKMSNLNNPGSKKNYSNKSNENNNIGNNNYNNADNIIKINNYNNSKEKQFNDNLAFIENNNSKGSHNKEKNLTKTCKLLQEECEDSIKKKLLTQIVLKEEIEKGENKINDNKYTNNVNLNNNIRVNESAISKLSSNIINSKAQNFKDTNIVKDENELLLNLTKTQNLTHFQDDNQTKNLLNSIDKEDNLLIKFNTGAVANSLLNNTNFKINESQSQQNISNINNNPSICEENKSDRFSFKFDLTSNFDLHSRFSKFDSTNNISRIKVPYYENNNNNNNNYEQNYTLTNVSHTQDLNNITNLNNNNNNNANNNFNSNNNQNNNLNNQNNNNKNLNNPLANSKPQQKDLQNIPSKLHKESTDNMDEEEIQLSITLSVRASKFEAMYPIWIDKNREVEFKVIGKWSIDSTFPMCDCNGYQIKNKKETCNNGNSNSNNNNNSNITSSTNYYTASTNNTNMNINVHSKNFNVNSDNLVVPNSPTGNKEKNMQEGLNKEADLIEVDKKSSNVNSALMVMRDSENNANLNVNVENKNTNKNEIRIGYIGPSTIVKNNSDNNNDNPTKNENSNTIEITNNPHHLDQKHKNDSNLNSKYTNNNNNGLNCLLENYPNGCLIGRVLGGPYFRISSKCTFISEHSGPLFLKMNIHDLRLNPEGKLSVFINGADDLPFMSIEKKLGWDINNLSLGCQLLKTESERLIYTFINKIRLNSNLFAQQYLENIKTLSNTTNNLYVSLFQNKESFNLMNMDAKLIEYGRRLVKREIERLYNLSTTSNNSNNLNGNNKTNFISIINSNNPSAKNRQEVLESENKQILEYEKNLNISGYSNLKYFIKKHEDTKPLSVAIKLIIDEKARQEILSKNNNSVGLLTIKLPQAQKGFYTCLLFGNLNSEQNLITDINRNESEIMMTD